MLVASLSASAQKKTSAMSNKKPEYEVFNGILVGVNIADPILRAFGQAYGGSDVVVEANIYNRFFPEFTMGIGSGKITSEDSIHIKVPAAMYFKIGMSYNFKFNSEQNNYFVVTARYGFSSYKSDFYDLKYNDGSWPVSSPQNILNQKFNSHWVEVGGGIRVQVYRNLYMGWNVQYRFFVQEGSTKYANPWYVPGYGRNGNTLGLTYNVYYQLPFWSKKKRVIE